VDIFKHTAKKIRKLNEQINFYLKCMVPPEMEIYQKQNIYLLYIINSERFFPSLSMQLLRANTKTG
jgi:hypothetical protein